MHRQLINVLYTLRRSAIWMVNEAKDFLHCTKHTHIQAVRIVSVSLTRAPSIVAIVVVVVVVDGNTHENEAYKKNRAERPPPIFRILRIRAHNIFVCCHLLCHGTAATCPTTTTTGSFYPFRVCFRPGLLWLRVVCLCIYDIREESTDGRQTRILTHTDTNMYELHPLHTQTHTDTHSWEHDTV